MPSWNAFSYTFGPLVALVGIGILVVILRWAFKPGQSLIERPVAPGSPDDYGLMIPIASPRNLIEGEMERMKLDSGGIKANLVNTTAGPRIMVWPKDEKAARKLLGG